MHKVMRWCRWVGEGWEGGWKGGGGGGVVRWARIMMIQAAMPQLTVKFKLGDLLLPGGGEWWMNLVMNGG